MGVSTSIILVERDRWVIEQHTDSTGRIHTFHYCAAVTDDRNALLTAHAAELANRLAAEEFEAIVYGG